jgi:hypothetical protein
VLRSGSTCVNVLLYRVITEVFSVWSVVLLWCSSCAAIVAWTGQPTLIPHLSVDCLDYLHITKFLKWVKAQMWSQTVRSHF